MQSQQLDLVAGLAPGGPASSTCPMPPMLYRKDTRRYKSSISLSFAHVQNCVLVAQVRAVQDR